MGVAFRIRATFLWKPNAESAEKGEAWALSQYLIKERDERLGIIWADTVMRLSRALEDIEVERAGE